MRGLLPEERPSSEAILTLAEYARSVYQRLVGRESKEDEDLTIRISPDEYLESAKRLHDYLLDRHWQG